MVRTDEQLNQISAKLQNKEDVPTVTVRTFLSWFGAQRRSYWNVFAIRAALRRSGLETDPDFESAYIDSDIRFVIASSEIPDAKKGKISVAERSPENLGDAHLSPASPIAIADPTYRISKLEAANKSPVSVPPDAPLRSAVTLMMASDYSQLPVVTGPRDIKGIISWNSIGSRMVLGKKLTHVRDAMDVHQEIRSDASMFQAIPTIVQHGYVLIRGGDTKLSGIVTASDLSVQFQQLAEPFLLLGEIENHIRGILDGKFETADFVAIRDPSDTRKIEAASDLSFGEYVRLLENEARWNKVDISLDRKTFCDGLDSVRKIRNDVMHFDPDGILPVDLEQLRDFAKFLQRLQTIKAY